MKVWEFEITRKADLGPFHDLLLESGHEVGAATVARMIKEKKFPGKFNYGYGSDRRRTGYRWSVEYNAFRYDKLTACKVTDGIFVDHQNRYHTITEAVWGLINTGKFI